MKSSLEDEIRRIIPGMDEQHNNQEQDIPETTGQQQKPLETIHIHYFPDAIVILKEDNDNPQPDDAVEATLVKTKKPLDFIAYSTVLFYILLILSCITFQLYCIFNPPIAIVTIMPKTQQVIITGALQLGRMLSPLTLSQSQTVPTTGKGHQDAQEASGTVTFYNGQQTGQTVAQGTVFTGRSGVSIETTQRATIPPGNPSTGYGTVTVTAQAVEAGSQGNIQVGDVNVPIAIAVFVKNNRFTGGQDERDFSTVNSQDINKISTSLKATLAQSMQGAMLGQVKPDEQLDTLPCSVTITADHKIAQEASQVKVTASETCSGVAYNQNTLQSHAIDLLSSQAAKNLGSGYNLLGTIHISITQVTVSHTTPILLFSCHGIWVYTLDHTVQEHFKRLIAGKSKGQAVSILSRMSGIQAVRIAGVDDNERLPKNQDLIIFHALIVGK